MMQRRPKAVPPGEICWQSARAAGADRTSCARVAMPGAAFAWSSDTRPSARAPRPWRSFVVPWVGGGSGDAAERRVQRLVHRGLRGYLRAFDFLGAVRVRCDHPERLQEPGAAGGGQPSGASRCRGADRPDAPGRLHREARLLRPRVPAPARARGRLRRQQRRTRAGGRLRRASGARTLAGGVSGGNALAGRRASDASSAGLRTLPCAPDVRSCR